MHHDRDYAHARATKNFRTYFSPHIPNRLGLLGAQGIFWCVIQIQGETEPDDIQLEACPTCQLPKNEMEVIPCRVKMGGGGRRARPKLSWPCVTDVVRLEAKWGIKTGLFFLWCDRYYARDTNIWELIFLPFVTHCAYVKPCKTCIKSRCVSSCTVVRSQTNHPN